MRLVCFITKKDVSVLRNILTGFRFQPAFFSLRTVGDFTWGKASELEVY